MQRARSSQLLPILLASALMAVPALANAERIQASLDGYAEVPSVSTMASGQFRGMISRTGDSIDYQLSYSGLQADVTMAHVHFAQEGVNGGVIFWLCGTPALSGPPGTPACPQEGTVSGTITAAEIIGPGGAQQLEAGDIDAAIAAIRAGATYVNVHTVTSPGGEIRGQVRGSRR